MNKLLSALAALSLVAAVATPASAADWTHRSYSHSYGQATQTGYTRPSVPNTYDRGFRRGDNDYRPAPRPYSRVY